MLVCGSVMRHLGWPKKGLNSPNEDHGVYDRMGIRGFSHDYAYDPIGNRTSSTEYDHEDHARVSSYTANELNQYEQRTVPGYAGVRGSATNNATVTVNGNSAWRLGKYFYGGDDVENAASAVMKELDITAVVNPVGTNEADLVESVTGKVFVAKSPEAFTYDDDGNMLSDGRFVYTWDGENRLASIETSEAAASVGASRVRVEYSYDHRSRRIGKVISRGGAEAQSWEVAESRTFVYDGWNMIREIQYSTIPSFHSSANFYVWGLDLSGSLQGAGGVGGLLSVSVIGGDDSGLFFPAFDGNGNVCEYTDAASAIVAHYEYSPFGETVVQSGDFANAFTFRFSTKYWEHGAKLYYYGYRFYSPNVGRWLGRDPLGEQGGVNLSGVDNNNFLSFVDLCGLLTYNVDARVWKEEFWFDSGWPFNYGDSLEGYAIFGFRGVCSKSGELTIDNLTKELVGSNPKGFLQKHVAVLSPTYVVGDISSSASGKTGTVIFSALATTNERAAEDLSSVFFGADISVVAGIPFTPIAEKPVAGLWFASLLAGFMSESINGGWSESVNSGFGGKIDIECKCVEGLNLWIPVYEWKGYSFRISNDGNYSWKNTGGIGSPGWDI